MELKKCIKTANREKNLLQSRASKQDFSQDKNNSSFYKLRQFALLIKAKTSSFRNSHCISYKLESQSLNLASDLRRVYLYKRENLFN